MSILRIDAPRPCGCEPTFINGDGGPKLAPCGCAGGRDDGEGPVEKARREMVQRHADAATRHLRTS